MPEVSVANTYDELPFNNHPFTQAHPSRLATVATLFGLNPTPVEFCRVLDLGCALGGHIIPMAELYPESEFVGIDLSARQIAEGNKVIQAAGLKNITLRHASIMDIDASYGTFDYIICHGVYSWVPEPVRQKILSVCAANLNPAGVAYVSYNTYPGWNIRGTIRDTILFHANRFETATQKVEQARRVLEALSQATAADPSEYSVQLRREVEFLRTLDDTYLFHEYLEGVNVPFYFHQFIAQAQQHRLRYLGEARMSTMMMTNCPPEAQTAIAAIATDQIQIEQTLDVVWNRPFRETLLVHPDANVNWTIHPDALRKLHASVLRYPKDEGVDVRSSTVAAQYTYTGTPQETANPYLKAAIRVLGQRWPGTVSFAELDRAVQELLGVMPDDGQQLADTLLHTYLATDLIELHTVSIPVVPAQVRPIALSVARATIAAGLTGVTTRRHEYFRTNELDQHILPLLDGTHDLATIRSKLVERVIEGELQVHKAGQRLLDPAELQEALGRATQSALERYAISCLLKG